MRTFIIAIIVLAIIGGGYYLYSQSQTQNTQGADTTMQTYTPPPASGTTHTDASGIQGTNSQDTSTGGTGVRVNVGASAPSTGSEPASTGTTKEIMVTGSNYTFSPKTITVNKGDTVKITFKNSGGMHDFVIDEFNVKTNRIQGGQQEVVTFVGDKAGSFQYYCSVGKHRAMGMWGTLTVNP